MKLSLGTFLHKLRNNLSVLIADAGEMDGDAVWCFRTFLMLFATHHNPLAGDVIEFARNGNNHIDEQLREWLYEM
jgi:hypothetical protein